MHPNIYIYISICVCVCVLHANTYIILLSVYVRIGRGFVCVQHCAMAIDRLCVHGLAGSCCGLGLNPETLNLASPGPSAWTACGFGAQVFYDSLWFNANIGAWNTARVTDLFQVCAAPGPAARTMADALGRASMRRGRLCAAAPPMRARVRTRAGTRLRGGLGVGTAGRTGGSIHASQCIHISVRVCVTRLNMHYPFICICENRSGLCMRAPVCDGDGSAVCACVGGLVLRARPEPETLNRASVGPSAWTACCFGAQAFDSAFAFNANIGAWNTARVTTLYYVCAAPGPAARTMADALGLGRASMRRSRLCAAAPPMRALLRTRAGTRLRGALGVAAAALMGFSILAFEYIFIHMCVRVCFRRVYLHHPFICTCENRSGLCMRAPVCDG
jgi:hypothetical protein